MRLRLFRGESPSASVDFRNSRTALPIELASFGNLVVPNISRTMVRIIRSSGSPIPLKKFIETTPHCNSTHCDDWLYSHRLFEIRQGIDKILEFP